MPVIVHETPSGERRLESPSIRYDASASGWRVDVSKNDQYSTDQIIIQTERVYWVEKNTDRARPQDQDSRPSAGER